MSSWREKLRIRVRDSIVLLPALFVLAGLLTALVVLRVDAAVGIEGVPSWLYWTPGSARFLYATLAGAMLTFAGLVFVVRSTIVSLAASQYSARVVVGFLQDRVQQTMMSLMLGLFTYIITVLRALPDPDPGVGPEQVPQWSVLLGIVATIGAVTLVLAAIRNAVGSMYAGALARATTDRTVDAIRAAFPPLHVEATGREAGATGPAGGSAPQPRPPARRGRLVRANARGWIQAIDEDRLLELLPRGGVLQLEVRVGLYSIEGRPIATVWVGDEASLDLRGLAAAITLGRTRIHAADVETSLQTLVDIAVGSLETGAADVATTYEVIQHMEMMLRELAYRRLPTRVRRGAEGRVLIRDRTWSFEDYVRTAFDRLRRAGASYPTVCSALLNLAGDLALELEAEGFPDRARTVREQLDRVLLTAETADIDPQDLADLRATAARYTADHGTAGPA